MESLVIPNPFEYDTLGNPVCAYLHTEVELQNETLENKNGQLVEVFLTKDGSDEVHSQSETENADQP